MGREQGIEEMSSFWTHFCAFLPKRPFECAEERVCVRALTNRTVSPNISSPPESMNLKRHTFHRLECFHRCPGRSWSV